MTELPTGWAKSQLRNLIAADGLFTDGDWVESKDQDPQGNIRLLQLADIGDGRFVSKSSRFINETAFAQLRCTELAPGDVLVARMPDPLGRACLMPVLSQRCVTVVDVAAIRPGRQSVHPKWLMHSINAPQFRQAIESQSSGTTRKRISRGNLGDLDVFVPPRDEQQRIADKLDAVLARVDACRERLASTVPLLKRLRQSVFAAATSGRLTDDWRSENSCENEAAKLLELLQSDHATAGGHGRGNASDPTEEAHDLDVADIPETWVVATLRDACTPGRPITYGILKPGPELADGVPYVRVADFPGNRLRLETIKKTSLEIDEQYKRARLKAGDLLLSIRGSVGRLVVIPPALEDANITQDTARLSISNRILADYVRFALLCETTQRRMQKAVRGVAVRGINIGDVRALQIPLPPFKEQQEIVTRVKAILEVAGRLEMRLTQAQAATDRLTPALLAKAFRGELVPQDPADEPAAALLKRLASQDRPRQTKGRARSS